MLKKRISFIVAAALSLFISYPSYSVNSSQYPESPQERRDNSFGSIAGPEGFVIKLDNSSKAKQQDKDSIDKSFKDNNIEYEKVASTNKYLWQGAISYLSRLPIISADFAGGTIVTDWYRDPKNKQQEIKTTVIILGSDVSLQSIKVLVHKRVLTKNLMNNKKSYKQEDNKSESIIASKILRLAKELSKKTRKK